MINTERVAGSSRNSLKIKNQKNDPITEKLKGDLKSRYAGYTGHIAV
jgi:hypothetical protein